MRETETQRFLADLFSTQALGQALGRTAEAGDVVLLRGELGAGKTSLTQGLARGLGISESVTSPTFALLHEHLEGRIPLYHFDLYRLEQADILAQGFPETWERGDGLTVIEWAERLGSLTPHECLEVVLAHQEEGRAVSLRGHGARHVEWLEQLP